jgi:hypothetical protein
MRLEHPCLAIEYQWVVEPGDLHLVPGLAEYNVTLQYLVFEGSSEAAIRSVFFDDFLDLTSNSADCADLGPGKLGHLKLAVKHALDKGGVFVNLERLTNKLQLLHYFELGVELDDSASDTDTEVRDVLSRVILELLDSNE